MTWQILVDDCRAAMQAMPDASVDAVLTDPPYELTQSKGSGRGFMGKAWDGSGIAFDVGMWREVLRVLKPGGHMLAFGGTRTSRDGRVVEMPLLDGQRHDAMPTRAPA